MGLAADGWTKRTTLTIPASSVGTGGLTEFTCPLHQDMISSAVWSDIQANAQTLGQDLRITTDEAGENVVQTRIYYTFAGLLRGVFGPVALSATVSNTLYLWWGNSEPSAMSGNPCSSRVKVYSPEGGATNLAGANGTATSLSRSLTPTQFGYSHIYNGTTSKVLFGNPSSLEPPFFAFSLARITNTGNRTIVAAGQTSNTSRDYQVWANPSFNFIFAAHGSGLSATGGTSLENNWRLYGGIFTASDDRRAVYNESLASTSSTSVPIVRPNQLAVGIEPNQEVEVMDGNVQEVYFIQGTSDAEAWVKTHHNAIFNPASFASSGAVEDVGGAGGGRLGRSGMLNRGVRLLT